MKGSWSGHEKGAHKVEGWYQATSSYIELLCSWCSPKEVVPVV
jgi:hypothetical protein